MKRIGRPKREWAQTTLRAAGGCTVFIDGANILRLVPNDTERIVYRVRPFGRSLVIDVRPYSDNGGSAQ